MRTQKYYKVVRYCFDEVDGDPRLASVCALSTHTVFYALGEWTKPNSKGKPFLFVFKSRERARRFRRQRPHKQLAIFECEVRHPTDCRGGCGYAYNGALFDTNVLMNGWPFGTCFVDAVKLTRKVD